MDIHIVEHGPEALMKFVEENGWETIDKFCYLTRFPIAMAYNEHIWWIVESRHVEHVFPIVSTADEVYVGLPKDGIMDLKLTKIVKSKDGFWFMTDAEFDRLTGKEEGT